MWYNVRARTVRMLMLHCSFDRKKSFLLKLHFFFIFDIVLNNKQSI